MYSSYNELSNRARLLVEPPRRLHLDRPKPIKRVAPGPPTYRLIELIRSPCIYPLIKGFADVGAGQPQFDVARFFDHRVLCALADGRLA